MKSIKKFISESIVNEYYNHNNISMKWYKKLEKNPVISNAELLEILLDNPEEETDKSEVNKLTKEINKYSSFEYCPDFYDNDDGFDFEDQDDLDYFAIFGEDGENEGWIGMMTYKKDHDRYIVDFRDLDDPIFFKVVK